MATFESFTGQSVNNTTGVSPAADVGDYIDNVALEVNVTAIGATPTMTVALEGSMDGTNWFQILAIPNDTDVAALTQVYTTTGRRILFMKTDLGKFYRYFRSNVSANLNVTATTTIWALDRN